MVGLPDAQYGEEVTAAVVLAPGAVLDVATLRAHCAACWPATRCRSHVVEVEQLPRNPHTGKVQRTDVVALLLAPAGGRSNRDRHAAGRRGAAGAAGRARPRALRHSRGCGSGQAAQAGAELVVLPELASTGLLASDPSRGSAVADVPSAYRRIFPPCVEPIADVPLRELATTHGLAVLGGSHYRRAADGTYRNTALLAHGTASSSGGRAPPDPAGAGDGHDPGRRGARHRVVRPPSRSRSAPTSSSRRSAGTWPSTGSTWSSARR